MSDGDPDSPRPRRPYSTPIIKAKIAIGGSVIVGVLMVNVVAPDMHTYVSAILPANRLAAIAIVSLVYGGLGFIVLSAIVWAWRRLERWRLARQTWHRRSNRQRDPLS